MGNGVLPPPTKPCFIDYHADHFHYKGRIDDFIVVMGEVSKVVAFYFKYDKKKYAFKIVTYPNDEKISYAIQLYSDNNSYVVEFHRLDGYGFLYRDHVMEVWTALNTRGIGPGVPSTAKPPMPSFNVVNDDYEIDEKVLIPMLERVVDENVHAQILGLKMLLHAVKAGEPALKAVKEADVLSKVIDCGLKSNHIEVDRLVGAVLRELLRWSHELKKENCAYDLAMQKIDDYKQNKKIEAREVQRNFIMVLNKYKTKTY